MPFSRIGSLKDIRQYSLVPDRESFEAGKNSRSLWWLQSRKVNCDIQFFWRCCGIFLGGYLSNTARDLLLASWQTKPNKTYDSHFKTWLCWCSSRSLDPVSGPVSEGCNIFAGFTGKGINLVPLMCSDMLFLQCMTKWMVWR